MKKLIELSQKMLTNEDIWQITSVKHEKIVSMKANYFVEMVVELAFNKELQKKIQEAQIAMDAEESYMQDHMEEDAWFAPSFSKEDRIKEFMAIYMSEQLKDLEDDDIPF